MSPVPLIELQRRLSLVGAIRAGGEKQPKAPGRKLEAYRLTSPRRDLIEQAATLYGGSVTPWKSPTGDEWQVYTEAAELPILIIVGYSLRQSYELWEGASRRERLCDGVDEELTGGPCICNAEGLDRCDLYTRLVVALPELDTVLGWRLITRGANAGHELPSLLDLLEAKGARLVPAKLRLDQRRGVTRQEGKEPQVVRFVVPTIDLGVGYLALAAPTPAPDGSRELVAAGFTPAPRREATVEQALAVRPSPSSPAGGSRRAAAWGPDIDPETRASAGQLSPPPQPPPQPQPAREETAPVDKEQTARLQKDEPMWKKLNVQVGQLREAGQITTANLWDAVAKLRDQGGEDLVLELGGYDAEHQLHWSPLRDNLTRPEAVQLIDRLAALEAKTMSTGEAVRPEAASPEGGQEATQPEPEDDPFPPGY